MVTLSAVRVPVSVSAPVVAATDDLKLVDATSPMPLSVPTLSVWLGLGLPRLTKKCNLDNHRERPSRLRLVHCDQIAVSRHRPRNERRIRVLWAPWLPNGEIVRAENGGPSSSDSFFWAKAGICWVRRHSSRYQRHTPLSLPRGLLRGQPGGVEHTRFGMEKPNTGGFSSNRLNELAIELRLTLAF